MSEGDRDDLVAAARFEMERLLDTVESWLPSRILPKSNQTIYVSMPIFPSRFEAEARAELTDVERERARRAARDLREMSKELDEDPP